MSSILEALKKLEEEKATRLSGAEHIAGKVVRSGRRARQRPGWWLPAGMACAALIAAAATYIFTGGFFAANRQLTPPAAPASPQKTVAVSPAVPPQAAQIVAVPPAASVQAPQSVATPPVGTASPPHVPAVAARNRAPALSPHPAVVRPKPLVNSAAQQQAGPKVAERPAPPQAAQPSLPAPAPSRPKLTVTGIGWQKDNGDRLAVVNGRAVSEGTVIEGAKVEEIFPDRVKFSVGEQTFEISLGKPSGGAP
ncbi:MAG TPA: general secretion pathway protein GspB [Geobacteraceae bacterium]